MVRTASLALLAVTLLIGNAVGSAQTVQVYEGAALVTENAPISFGVADVAAVKPKTFIVRNTGDTAISINPLIQTPQGFTARRPNVQTLVPGAETTISVSLNAARAGYFAGNVVVNTSAGAVTFPINGSALGTPSVRIVDNTDPGFRTIGRWTVQNGAVTIQPGAGTNVAAWAIRGLIPGLYQVSATWSAGAVRATNAQYTLVNGSRATSVPVNQQAAPADFQDAGTTWQRLGQPFKIDGTTLVVQLSDLANGAVSADAVRIERVGQAGHITTASDAAFKAIGNWISSRGSNGRLNSTGTNGTATWMFDVPAGQQFRVSATWNPGSNLSTQAQYSVSDGNTVLATVPVNQRLTPSHFRDAGARWQDLAPQGGLYTIASGRLTVTLTAGGAAGPIAAEPVTADAIRIEQFNGPTIQSQQDWIRFLQQATWGPTPALRDVYVQGMTIQDYLIYQYSVPTSGYASQALYPQSIPVGFSEAAKRDHYTMYNPQLSFFTNGMYAEDQLKQRIAWALHKIFVVGATELDTRQPSRMVPYLQILNQHVLGDFRSLIREITLNPVMGAYLDMMGSTQARPNENYARQLLQLFTIGLDQLNLDGTPILDAAGNKIPAYDQTIVNAYTKVFTGWNLQAPVAAPPGLPGTVSNYYDPMIIATNNQARVNHDWMQKILLPTFEFPNGVVIPARPQAQQTVAMANLELTQALDSIFVHPNVGPFITKNLIQQLVTSNPTPGYVARAAVWFEDNGQGQRGDLSAVVWAILMDPEARTLPVDDNYGKLREPVQLTLNVLRAFEAYSYDGQWYSDGYINPQTSIIGQNVFNPPSVFSYFMPDYVLPGVIDVVSPEFQLFDATTSVRRANFVNTMTFADGIAVDPFFAIYGTKLTLQPLEALDDGTVIGAGAMADYLNELLLHGEMSAEMRVSLIRAINDVQGNTLKRVQTAVYLVLTSSQYQVQR